MREIKKSTHFLRVAAADAAVVVDEQDTLHLAGAPSSLLVSCVEGESRWLTADRLAIQEYVVNVRSHLWFHSFDFWSMYECFAVEAAAVSHQHSDF